MFTTMATNTSLDRRGLGGYLAIAFGLAWLIDLVVFLNGGLRSALFLPLVALQMFMPALATFVVTHWISPIRNVRTATGLRWGVKGTRWGLFYVLTPIVAVALIVGSLFVGAALGVYPMDLTNYSAYHAVLAKAPGGTDLLKQIPIGALVWIQILALPLVGLINSVATFGEEYGWRGYLLPGLLPLGQGRALILSGIIWGLWHAPIIAMGYNYPQHPYLGIALMCVFTTIAGILLGWTRLATGSVWPAVLGHAAINAAGGSYVLLAQAGASVDTAQATLLGWSGWILPLLLIGVLVATRRLPVRGVPDQTLMPASATPAPSVTPQHMAA
jgi:membrane protease YdiL (CAAX protease family)